MKHTCSPVLFRVQTRSNFCVFPVLERIPRRLTHETCRKVVNSEKKHCVKVGGLKNRNCKKPGGKNK